MIFHLSESKGYICVRQNRRNFTTRIYSFTDLLSGLFIVYTYLLAYNLLKVQARCPGHILSGMSI